MTAPAAVLDAGELARLQLEAYNAKDLDGFCALFASDVEVYDHPGLLLLKGAAPFRERYAARFATPGVRAEVAHRAVIGDRAVDHEFVWMDGPEAAPTELVVIYTARAGRIARVDFVRKAAQ